MVNLRRESSHVEQYENLKAVFDFKSSPSSQCDDSLLGVSQFYSNHYSASNLDVSVGIASTFDLLRLKRFKGHTLLHQPELQVLGYRFPGARYVMAQQMGNDCCTVIIGKSGRHLIAFADFRQELPDYRWNCVAVGDATGTHDPVPIIGGVIEEGIREAGIHGVKRIFAKAPSESELVDAFQSAGFVPYAQEVVFVAEVPRTLTMGAVLRPQSRTDTWSIHQLYNASVPKSVLQAEAFTSHRWDLPHNGGPANSRVEGWLQGDGFEPDVYVRSVSRNSQYILDIVCNPSNRDMVGSTIDAVLLRLQRQAAVKRVFVPVRTYALEMQNDLLTRGFRPWLEQTLMMRYTAVPLRAATTETSAAELESVERLPRRVPAYLTVERSRDRPCSNE
jgi:hypothetical protein